MTGVRDILSDDAGLRRGERQVVVWSAFAFAPGHSRTRSGESDRVRCGGVSWRPPMERLKLRESEGERETGGADSSACYFVLSTLAESYGKRDAYRRSIATGEPCSVLINSPRTNNMQTVYELEIWLRQKAMRFIIRIDVRAHYSAQVVNSEWIRRQLGIGRAWIRHGNEAWRDFLCRIVGAFVQFDMLGEPSISSVANHVHIIIHPKTGRVAAAVGSPAKSHGEEILIGRFFHPCLPEV